MIAHFEKSGVGLSEIEVKIFGGASILEKKRDTQTVGERNVETAETLVQSRGLRITGRHTGGAAARKIYFLTDTGEAYLSRIRRLQPNLH